MTLVVVWEDFGAVDLVGVVDWVIKSDNLGVIGGVVVVHVVKANMEAINAGVDDRDRHARAVVARGLLRKIHLMDHSSITVLNFQDAVEFQHHHARKGGGLQHHIVRDAPGNGIDQGQVPFVLVADFSFKHGHVGGRWGVVKVDDEREGAVFVEEKRVVVVTLHHVANAVAVAVNGGLDPPTLFFIGRRFRRHAH